MQVSHLLLVFTLRHISTHTSGTEFSSTVEKFFKAEVAKVPKAWTFLTRLRSSTHQFHAPSHDDGFVVDRTVELSRARRVEVTTL